MRRIRATIFSIITIVVLFIITQADEIGTPWPFTLVAIAIIVLILISLIRTWFQGQHFQICLIINLFWESYSLGYVGFCQDASLTIDIVITRSLLNRLKHIQLEGEAMQATKKRAWPLKKPKSENFPNQKTVLKTKCCFLQKMIIALNLNRLQLAYGKKQFKGMFQEPWKIQSLWSLCQFKLGEAWQLSPCFYCDTNSSLYEDKRKSTIIKGNSGFIFCLIGYFGFLNRQTPFTLSARENLFLIMAVT